VSTVARFGFHVLTIPLIFSTIASSVTVDSIGDYWFIFVGAFGVLGISFLTATLLSYIIPISNPRDFCALRISATFPNIVALPILIFPSLCEYEVVCKAFGGTGDDTAELYRTCVARSNTMIFCYFFGWSLLFWSVGASKFIKRGKDESYQAGS
jgi:predicted permease